MLVRDFMKNNPRQMITVRSDAVVAVAMGLLIDNRISCLPVVTEGNELIGIISDKDIFIETFNNPQGYAKSAVADLMSTDLIVGVVDDDFDYIGGVMTKNRIRHVPIVEDKQLVGLLSLGDIVKAQLKSMEIENRYLRQYIDDTYPG